MSIHHMHMAIVETTLSLFQMAILEVPQRLIIFRSRPIEYVRAKDN